MITTIAEKSTIVIAVDTSSAVVTTSSNATAVEVDRSSTISTTKENTVVVDAPEYLVVTAGGSQGPKGAPGDSINYVNILAGQALSGHAAVSANNMGYAVYADSTIADTGNRVLGVTTGAVSNGSLAQIQIVGVLEEPTWSWNLIDPIFIGINGQLTQTPPETGYLYIMGFPMTPTKIFIDKQPPIMLG